ncbi:hypothetical protein [Glutamicibacter sp. BW77]|uniref:hypothetical protein n=1 Tax=Glutamicibacter TaxID=1742989 RepID=UPI000BB755B4|nr:hypothetical protein [Glutamicibacter sp. BW77]PCC37321.1 hypothetical protein CIK74_01205 [Glutamicibacter sp. BW77]
MPKQLKAAILAAVLLVLFLSAQGTVASWRAEGTVDPTPITTGRMDLLAGDGTVVSKAYDFKEMNSNNLVPGSFAQAPLTLSVAGDVALDYDLSGVSSLPDAPTTADKALSSAAVLSIYAGMSTTNCASQQSLSGEMLYQGPATQTAKFNALRSLDIAESELRSEALCIRLAVPGDAPQTASGGRIKLVLNFVGQQK